MSTDIEKVLIALGSQPVLMDIGASGAPPLQWEPIAKSSVYVGFDPDSRQLYDLPDSKYARAVMVNAAVSAKPDDQELSFFLTASPYCSSTLMPDKKSLEN